METREIIQIAIAPAADKCGMTVFALESDGTVWEIVKDCQDGWGHWSELPELPPAVVK
jgi:hypothetical protein